MSSEQQQMMNINNINNELQIKCDLCERCKTEPSVLICYECQPFHKFCKCCDGIIHSLSIKANHNRCSLSTKHNIPSLPCQCHSTSIDNNETTYEHNHINNNSHNNNVAQSYSEQLEYINVSPLPVVERNFNYSKEYVLELQSIHQQETTELQHKVSTLQNQIERLKLTFQHQLESLQAKASLIESKAKLHEDEITSRTNTLLLEKDKAIQSLQAKNEDLLSQISVLTHKIEDLKSITSSNSECYNNQINTLKDEITKLKQRQNDLNIQAHNKQQDLISSSQNQLAQLNEQHNNEKKHILYTSQLQVDKMRKQLQTCLNEMQSYKNEKENLKQAVMELTNENQALVNENKFLKNNIEQLGFYADNEKMNSDVMKTEYENIRKENQGIKKDFDYLELTIQGLRKELNEIKETNEKKDKDDQALLIQSEKIRKDAQEKIFEVSYICL